MGKTTKAPSYSGGAVNVNGLNVANTTHSDNTVNSNFNMNPTQKKVYDSVQANMANVLNDLFAISEPQRQQWQNQLDTLQKVGLQSINDIYTPIQNSLKNDIAARFGNLDNSIFMNNLSSITNDKSKAIANLTNNLMLSQNDLYNQEIQNRMNILNLLNGLNNSINGNILAYMALANQNANSGNQYNQSVYQSSAPLNMLSLISGFRSFM